LKFLAVVDVDASTAEQSAGYTLTPSPTSAQWAQSGHGSILKDPWRYWDPYGEIGDPTQPYYIPCTKCHSAPGLLEYADTGANTVAAPLQLGLDCSGCHQPNPPSTIWDERATYNFLDPVAFPSTDLATFDNNSNICMTCHQGRSSTPQVNAETPNDVVQAPTDYTSYGFEDVHYFAAAAVLFGTDVQGGYEYDHDPGQGGAGGAPTYRGQNEFTSHGAVLNDCIACHMNAETGDDQNHTFMPVPADCATCHGNPPPSFPELTGTPGANYAAIQKLQSDLLGAIRDYATTGDPLTGLPNDSPVIYDAPEHPYWFKDNGMGSIDANAYVDFDFKMLTAAYNYHLSIKEPGGYIHNGAYIQQLLYDSILEMGGAPSVTPPGR
jgi:hypothetical protein